MLAGLKQSFWYRGYITCVPPLRKLLHLLQTDIPDLHSGKGMVDNCTNVQCDLSYIKFINNKVSHKQVFKDKVPAPRLFNDGY